MFLWGGSFVSILQAHSIVYRGFWNSLPWARFEPKFHVFCYCVDASICCALRSFWTVQNQMVSYLTVAVFFSCLEELMAHFGYLLFCIFMVRLVFVCVCVFYMMFVYSRIYRWFNIYSVQLDWIFKSLCSPVSEENPCSMRHYAVRSWQIILYLHCQHLYDPIASVMLFELHLIAADQIRTC